MIPSAFVVLASLPLTRNGKVDRKALPRPDTHQSNRSEIALPLTETERALSDIWRRAVGLEYVGLDDNFFELGGHSLLAVRVIAEINKTLNMHVNVPEFFQNPTIEELARSIESKRRVPVKPEVLLLQAGKAGPVYFIGTGPAENRIAKFMGENRAVFGTNVPLPMAWRRTLTSANQAEWPTIERLGSLHGEVIRAHVGKSPCIVAGYSFHGKVVIEAARTLQRAGTNLAIVLLIDATAWTGRAHAMRETFRSIWANGTADDIAYIGRFYASLRRSVNSLSWWFAQAPPILKGRLARLVSPDLQEDATGWFDEEGAPVTTPEIAQLFLRQPFNPRSLDAASVLFRARRPGDEVLPRGGFDNGWSGRFARGLEIIEVKGDHMSLVRDERNVAALALQINSVLDRYEAERAVGMTRPKDKAMISA
jgi:thioesterase domain-containing protein